MDNENSLDSANLTKKERKELRRSEKNDEIKKIKRSKTALRFLVWGVVIIVLGVALWGIYALASRQPVNSSGDQGLPAGLRADDHAKGDKNAPVVLVEYSDFQCPACRTYVSVIGQIMEDFDGKIYFVYRHFPLKSIHANAEGAARASEAADKQGKFWEMHDLIFENQSRWENAARSKAEEMFRSYAGQLGLDVERFGKDFNSDEVKKRVDRDFGEARIAGLNATPTLYVNGRKIQPSTYDEFANIVSKSIQPQQ